MRPRPPFWNAVSVAVLFVAFTLPVPATAGGPFRWTGAAPYDEARTWPACAAPCTIVAANATTGGFSWDLKSEGADRDWATMSLWESTELPPNTPAIDVSAKIELAATLSAIGENGSAWSYFTVAASVYFADCSYCASEVQSQWFSVIVGCCTEQRTDSLDVPLQTLTLAGRVVPRDGDVLPAGPLKVAVHVFAQTDTGRYYNQQGPDARATMSGQGRLVELKVVGDKIEPTSQRYGPPGKLRDNITALATAPYESGWVYETCCRESSTDPATGDVSLRTRTQRTTEGASTSNHEWGHAEIHDQWSVPVHADSIRVTSKLHVKDAYGIIEQSVGSQGSYRVTHSLYVQHSECWNSCGAPGAYKTLICSDCTNAPATLEDDEFVFTVTLRSADSLPIPPGTLDVEFNFDASAAGAELDVLLTNLPSGSTEIFFDATVVEYLVEVDPAGGSQER